MKRRVVITGIGMVSPLGNDIATNWKNLTEGKSGIKPIEHMAIEQYSTRFAGVIDNFAASDFISPKEAKKMDVFIQYGVAAGLMALDDSGLEVTDENAVRVGCSIGSGIGGLTNIEANYDKLSANGPRKVSPFFVPSTIINMISGYLSIMRGLKGPNLSIVTACTTGVHNIGNSVRMIAYGDADVMLAGGAEKASTQLGMGGFGAAKALSTRNDDPQSASRPWDQDRDGFVLGDGAGVLVLEEYEHAKARGAKIYAEVVGYGMSSDAFHITSPPPDGSGAANAMANAIKDADVSIDKIGYINAHGTSTPAGDLAETNGVKSVFGDLASSVAVSSSKSMTGHLLGAAGAIETIITALTLQHQVITPTINLDNPGEGCDLDYVPHEARDVKNLEYALCNSFGFGGTNGSVLLKRV